MFTRLLVRPGSIRHFSYTPKAFSLETIIYTSPSGAKIFRKMETDHIESIVFNRIIKIITVNSKYEKPIIIQSSLEDCHGVIKTLVKSPIRQLPIVGVNIDAKTSVYADISKITEIIEKDSLDDSSNKRITVKTTNNELNISISQNPADEITQMIRLSENTGRVGEKISYIIGFATLFTGINFTLLYAFYDPVLVLAIYAINIVLALIMVLLW